MMNSILEYQQCMSKPHIIILLGNSGAGKGTQAELLLQTYSLEYIGSGNLLRTFSQGDHFSARKIKQIMGAGRFVPSFLIGSLWTQIFEHIKNAESFAGFILDGSPRRMEEAEVLDEALAWYEWEQYARFIYLHISDEEALRRITHRKVCSACGHTIPYTADTAHLERCPQCGGALVVRADDKDIHAIQSRIAMFKKEVEPVLERYRSKNVLITVNGEQPIAHVLRDIEQQLA